MQGAGQQTDCKRSLVEAWTGPVGSGPLCLVFPLRRSPLPRLDVDRELVCRFFSVSEAGPSPDGHGS